MGLLINQLVTLSRMDEDTSNLAVAEFDLSNMAFDTVSEFEDLRRKKKKHLMTAIEPFYSLQWRRGADPEADVHTS